MDSNTVTISELISGMLAEARRLGMSEATIWRDWEPKANSVVMYYRKRGLCVYSSEVTEEYLKSCEQRYEAGELAYSSLHQIRQILRRIHEYYVTGTLRKAENTRGSRYSLCPENEHLVDVFITERGYGKNTCNDVAWVVKHYLHYCESLGHFSLATVTVKDVQQYILKTASEMKLNSLHDVFLYLRHFHAYLKENGYAAPDCVELFSHKVQRENHVQGYVTDEELERILGVIDKESEKGKRDYAIILLAATTGLRACDIIRLKLTDVDWRRGEISIVQDKNGNKVCLRDRFLMIFLYDTGARISEALGVRLRDVKLGNSPQVLLFGKGNKVRAVPLMEKTLEHLQQYIAVFHKDESLTSAETLLYVLHKGKKEPMNDETVRVRLQKYADSAREKCPEIPQKVHPHLWRHTRAMHLYQHGMDLSLVSQWLGHANLSTSLVYAYADTQHKRDAIEKAMGGEHSGITDTTLCTVDDDALLKKLYGM